MDRKLTKIISQCRKNDRQAQFDLYHHCFDYLLAICFRYKKQREDAVSLLNDAFLKILLNLDSYDEKQDFLPWISSITVRTAIDEYRREKRYKEQTDLKETDAELEEPHLNPGLVKVVDEMSAEEVKELIYHLPEPERMVFVLYEWEGYQHKEIASKLDCSERSSKRYLNKAKELLRRELSHKQALKKVI
ncbi:RNA polymerase sigma factor [Croceimicrobium sp.]|uniref:RNA polymerase sigma factor n=1 Tax=Croceimicrobium sp. TaxID=2828340 RepID=UPI003BA8AAB8